MTTLYDVARELRISPLDNPKDYRSAKTLADVVSPVSPVLGVGMHELNPAQLAGLRVDPFRIADGETQGYQRTLVSVAHLRSIANHRARGGTTPPLQLAINGSGEPSVPWVMDGQHRGLAAILTGKTQMVTVEHLDQEQMRKRFHDQNKAKRIDRSLEVMTGTAPADLYVQKAIIEPSHSWHGMVGQGGHPLISPSLMHSLISAYVRKSAATVTLKNGQRTWMGAESFDEAAADELARLVAAFGTYSTNPAAFRAIALRAITACAIKVLPHDSPTRRGDITRWHKHMPKFKWQQHAHMTSSRELTLGLLQHWNMRLPAGRRVQW